MAEKADEMERDEKTPVFEKIGKDDEKKEEKDPPKKEEKEPPMATSEQGEFVGEKMVELPTTPIAWSVSTKYKREAVTITDFLEISVFDLEYTTRQLISDAVQDRLVLGKPTVVRASNQEVETANTSYVSAFLGQRQYDLTMMVSSRSPSSGTSKSLGLGVANIGSSMVKDLSARLRSGTQGAPGTLTTTSSNAEADGIAKRILSRVSEGNVLVNSSYLQAMIFNIRTMPILEHGKLWNRTRKRQRKGPSSLHHESKDTKTGNHRDRASAGIRNTPALPKSDGHAEMGRI